jgi:hypothetical protein
MSMSHLQIPGKIDLKKAEVEFGVYEECESTPSSLRHRVHGPAPCAD